MLTIYYAENMKTKKKNKKKRVEYRESEDIIYYIPPFSNQNFVPRKPEIENICLNKRVGQEKIDVELMRPLTREEEMAFFIYLNWNKYKKNNLKREIESLKKRKNLNNSKILDLENKIREYDSNIDEAKREIIASNNCFIIGEAIRYMRHHRNLKVDFSLGINDLFSYAVINLFEKTIDRFDYRKGIRFWTFAYPGVRCSFSKAARENRVIDYPPNYKNEIEILSLNRKKMDEDGPTSTPVIELINEQKQERTDFDILSRFYAEKLFMIVEKMVYKNNTRNFNRKLSIREFKFLKMRFGFDDGESKSLRKISEYFGITKQRASQIEKNIFRKLRNNPEIKHLEYFNDIIGNPIYRK